MQEIDPAARNTQFLRESREGVRSLQFFIAAMAAQLRDMTEKLNQVEPFTVGGESSGVVTQLKDERDAAREEVSQLNARVQELEHYAETLKQALERQKISFADHHAAKQEIARLGAELESLRGSGEHGRDQESKRKR